jgi:hypothetical protein
MAEREACITIRSGVFQSFLDESMKAVADNNIEGMPSLRGMVYKLTDEDTAAFHASFVDNGWFASLSSVMTIRRAFGDALSDTYDHNMEGHRSFQGLSRDGQKEFLEQRPR